MSWMPWLQRINKHRCVPSEVLEARGRGYRFSYGVQCLEEGLYAVIAWHGDVLIFLGLSETESNLENVLHDMQDRSIWKHATWAQEGTVPDFHEMEFWGTPFQVAVWEALLRIPKGKTVSYSDIAWDIGNPKAVRAVGTAISMNPVSALIPCHRVLSKAGGVGAYRWGPKIKKVFLAREGVL